MDLRALDDAVALLSLLALPFACGGDDGAMTTSTTGEETGAAGSSSQTGASLTTDASSSADSSGESMTTDDGGSSSSISTSGGSTSAGAESTSGEVGPVCQAYVAKIEECYPDQVDDEQEAVADCEVLLDAYAEAGLDCHDAVEGLFICRSEATCRELSTDVCAEWDFMIEASCP